MDQIQDFYGKMVSIIGDSTDEEISGILKKDKLTLSVAESLTGGLISERLTRVPGASEYFTGGIVSYSNRAKVLELNVPASLIASEGPVSKNVAVAMAENVRKLFKTDIGLSVTGVAGPATVSPPKPVGLVFIAVSSQKGTDCRELMLTGDRKEIRQKASIAALGILWFHLTGQTLDKG